MNATKRFLALVLATVVTVSSFQFSGFEVKASEIEVTEDSIDADSLVESDAAEADATQYKQHEDSQDVEEQTADVAEEEASSVEEDALELETTDEEVILKDSEQVTITFVFGHETGNDPVKDLGYYMAYPGDHCKTKDITVPANEDVYIYSYLKYGYSVGLIKSDDLHYSFTDKFYTDEERQHEFTTNGSRGHYTFTENTTLYPGFKLDSYVVTVHAGSESAYFDRENYSTYSDCPTGINVSEYYWQVGKDSSGTLSDASEFVKNTNPRMTLSGYTVDADGSGTKYGTSSRYDTSSESDLNITGDMDLYLQWEKKNNIAILTLDANGGYFENFNTEEKFDTQEYEIKSYSTTYSTIGVGLYNPDEHKAIVGWAKDKNATEPEYSGHSIENIKENPGSRVIYDFNAKLEQTDTTLYAVWTDLYKVATLHANGGQFYDGNDTYVIKTGNTNIYLGSDSDKPTREGYVFDGWYTDAACKNPLTYDYYGSESLTIHGDIDLYANWTKSCTVTFDFGDGTAVSDNNYSSNTETGVRNVAAGKTLSSAGLTVPKNPTPNNTNQAFVGWYKDSGFTQKIEKSDILNLVINDDITFYAKYEDAYTVTFDAMGGTFASSSDETYSVKVAKGQKIGGKYPTIIDSDDKVFSGWFTEKEGSSVKADSEIDNIAEYVVNEDVTIYAGYGEYFTVTFHSNMDGVYLNGESETISVKVPKGKAYKYFSWRGNDGTEYYDNNFPTIEYKEVDGKLPITNNLNSAYSNSSYASIQPYYSTKEDGTGSLYCTGNSHYIDGEYISYREMKEIGFIPTSDLNLYVVWDDTITVTLKSADGFVNPNYSNGYSDEETTWNKFVEFSEDNKEMTISVPKGTTLSALHQVVYNLSPKQGVSPSWCKDAGLTEQIYASTVMADKATYYVKWDKYNDVGDAFVVFDAGEGYFDNPTDKEHIQYYKTSTGITSCLVPAIDDNTKAFSGWYTDPECKNLYNSGVTGSGGYSSSGNNVSIRRYSELVIKGGVKKLYAGYTSAKHVTLNANGGYFETGYYYTENPAEEIKAETSLIVKESYAGKGIEISHYSTLLRREGSKIFAGWYTDAECTQKALINIVEDDNDAYIPTKNETTLYAKWVDYDATAVKINEESVINLEVGQTYQLKIEPYDADYSLVVTDYNHSDENGVMYGRTIKNIVSLTSDGKVTGVSGGYVIIYAMTSGAKSNKVTIRVAPGAEEEEAPIVGEKLYASIPTASIASGSTVAKNTRVQLFTETIGADIRYTTDGSTPTINSSTYVDAIVISGDMTIKAIAVKGGYVTSDVATFTYTVAKNSWGDVPESLRTSMFGNDSSNVPEGMWYLIAGQKYEAAGQTEYATDYTGNAITFSEDITVFQGTTKLVEKRDYTLSFANNKVVAAKDAKKAPKLTVTAKGNYSGKAVFTFAITQADLSAANLTSENNVAVKVGKSVKLGSTKPAYSFNGKKLAFNKDYVLKYYKYTTEGKVNESDLIADPAKELITTANQKYYIKAVAKDGSNFRNEISELVLVRGIDNKTTVQASTLKIAAVKGKSLKLDYNAETAYSLATLLDNSSEDKDPTILVKSGNTVLTYGKDYKVVAVDGNDYKSAGKQYFKIVGLDRELTEAQIEAKEKSYSGSKTVNFEIKGIALNKAKFAGLKTSVEYTGSEITMAELFNSADKNLKDTGWNAVTLYTVNKDKSKNALIEGKDYELQWHNTGAVGKFTIVFTGKNEYTGTVKKTVTVKAYNFKNDAENKLNIQVDNAKYTKTGAKPAVTVKFGDVTLKEGVDYKLSYKNNTKIVADTTALNALKANQRPTVTVTGIGNFTGGNASANFCITKANIANNVTLDLKDVAFNKNGAKKYFKKAATGCLKDDGKAISIGTGKDIEKITNANFEYTYAENTTLVNGDSKVAGETVADTDKVQAGTLIKVSVTVKCSEKSPYTADADGTKLTGYFRIIDGAKDISKYSVKVVDPSKLSYSDGAAVVPLKAENLIVYKGNVKLESNWLKTSDYEIVSITNNKQVGNATLVIRGKGEFGGTKTVKIKINKKSL